MVGVSREDGGVWISFILFFLIAVWQGMALNS